MKKLLFIISLVSLTSYANKVTNINSKIKQVTVYQQGAQIQRSASYNIIKGINTVIIEGISSNIDPRSLQIKASGNVIILDSKYTVSYPQPEPEQNQSNIIPPKIQREISLLEDSLFNLEYDISELQLKISVLNSEKTIIENNGTIKGVGKVNDSIPLLEDAITFYHLKMNAINKDILALSKSKVILVKKQARMNMRLGDLKNYNTNNNFTNQQNKAPIHQIQITLSAEVATSGNLDISYLVNNAGWTPIYDFRSSASESNIGLTYKAHVHQNTGVDWNGVKLNLSTNNPYANKTKPTLIPWYLDYYSYQQKEYEYQKNNNNNRSGAGSPNTAPSFENNESLDDVSFDAKTAKDYTTMIDQLISVEYSIDLPYDIKSDNENNMILVDSKLLSTDFMYYAIPKLDLGVYLVARITDLGELNLVPGKANLFHDGAYIGETFLNPTTMSDTMDISLGKDPNILVKRTLLKNETKEKIVGDKVLKTFAYQIDIKNHKNKNLKIIIQDQIPITRNSEIEVELLESSKGKLNEITGIINWSKKIKAYDSETINIIYTVKYEKTKDVNLAYY